MTDVAKQIMDRLLPSYRAAADPVKAGPMTAYMRDQFQFLGIPHGPRRLLDREVCRGLPPPSADDLRVLALDCWALPQREYQYFAADWLRRHASRCPPTFLATAEVLITTKSWWDTVDTLAAHVVGPIVLHHPQAVPVMADWVHADNLWLTRTAILHQLRYRERTDAERLFAACAAQAGHRDFFIRKAIGWALREYARTDPDSVARFVGAHLELSALSIREALKHFPDPADAPAPR